MHSPRHRPVPRPESPPAAIEIRRGLAPGHRQDAAWLYWQAFGGKLGRVMGPEPRALRYLDRVIREDHALTAVAADGTLLGIAGFQTWRGGFAAGAPGDLAAIYGRAGAAWRVMALRMLVRDVENRRFLLDGLCVRPDARGRGVGSALLHAIFAEARARGHDEVRLDVVEGNFRARALYERHGFTIAGTDRMGVLSLVFGFSSSTRMVRRVD